MTKALPRAVIEGEHGRIVIRVTAKGGYRIKATRFDGDAVGEMKMAALTADMLQEVLRSLTNKPDLTLMPGPIRHIDDHEKSA